MTEVEIEPPYEESSLFHSRARDANEFFDPLIQGKKNGDLLLKAIKIQGLSEFIVKRLKVDESKWISADDDEVLKKRMHEEAEKGHIVLPPDPVDKERWLSLVYIVSSEKHHFSYGNLLHPLHYLPESSDAFKEWSRTQGFWGLSEDIMSRRNELRRQTL